MEQPRGSPKDKATASTQAAREEEWAKPQCAFIYQSPTPHEEKKANLDLQCRTVMQTRGRVCRRPESMHDSTHTHTGIFQCRMGLMLWSNVGVDH